MDADDPYDLQRFVAAQDASGSYQRAVAELRRGRKQSHWMWYVFPQLAGLGQSLTARTYAISSLAEARAYLAHPFLGPRLVTCTQILTGLDGLTAEEVFGGIDAMKLRSCCTLFGRAALAGQGRVFGQGQVFGQVLDQYFGGRPDPVTGQLLAGQP
jgi:uncharacterized protein (DUF1810 family)